MANVAVSQAVAGQLEEALATLQGAYRQAPDEQFVLGAYAFVLARLGRRAEAERMLAELAAQPQPSAYLLATAYAGLGDRGRVLELLENSVAAKEPYALDLGVDPIFVDYRAEPRVQKLLAKLRLR
jgi:predicted Zn-dependent protease